MKIELAKNYGFCFGVKRAIKIAQNSPNSATIGELIHNKEEIRRLERDFSVKTLNDISQIKDEKKVIIRTHGITKDDLNLLKNNDFDVIDATCPFVKKPQQIVEKMSDQGYEIVIFGDENHPEVKGVKSYSKTPVHIVFDEIGAQNLNINRKIAVISQTTKKIEVFKKIVAVLMDKSKEIRVFNTICNATYKNQEATQNLAQIADVMVVIGGKNSSNTKQLFLISKQFCPDSYHIENEKELEMSWFKGKQICGVSAGASTPDWIIQNVIKKLSNFKE